MVLNHVFKLVCRVRTDLNAYFNFAGINVTLSIRFIYRKLLRHMPPMVRLKIFEGGSVYGANRPVYVYTTPKIGKPPFDFLIS
jgi:hypothetical protein